MDEQLTQLFSLVARFEEPVPVRAGEGALKGHQRIFGRGRRSLQEGAQEVGILKSLNYDRNIVQFYGACLQPGADPMLVCELMEGDSFHLPC